MADKKVRFYDVHKAVKEFKNVESDKQASLEERAKKAAKLMELAGAYLMEKGVDVNQPFDADVVVQTTAKSVRSQNEVREVVEGFKFAQQRINSLRPKEKPAPKTEPVDRAGAERKEWYNNVFKNGLRRSGGGDEINENNPLDWSRLRILKDGKLVPFMGEAHFGAPNDLQLELLQNEAKNGNLFFYRLGEEYPQHLVNGVWQSTDPTIGSKRPELKLPEPPKKPEPYTGTLEDELKARNLSPLMVNVSSPQQIHDENARERYMEAREAWRHKDAVSLREQKQYKEDLKKYESERARLTKEYETNLQDWQKKLDAYNKLGLNIKQAINDEAPQRKVTILRNQETKRADEMDARPLVDWYHNEFRKSMVRPSGAADLVESDGMDWSRVRIWDGEKFARALPEGHRGIPDGKALKSLRDAAQSGNLFMYQRGDKYPSKWMGHEWASMDKDWINKSKPVEVKNMEKLPKKPENRAGVEPQLKDYTKHISSRKLGFNRIFSFAYKAEAQEYRDAQSNYEAAKKSYDNAVADYNREMELYNEEMQALQKGYEQRLDVYNYMLKNYEDLTAKQKAAMENDVTQRAEEIKRNKEAQLRKAEDNLVKEQNDQNRVNDANERINAVKPRPLLEQFLNPVGTVQQPLGQKAYDLIAPNGYDLPANSVITPEDAAAIHVALAGSVQAAATGGLSPLSASQYGQMLDGVLYGRPSEADLKYIIASYGAAKGFIAQYEGGNPQPLADALSTGLRNLIAVGSSRLDLTPEMAGLAKLTERILDVMDRTPGLMEKCSLNKEEMNLARGMVNLGRIYNNALSARMDLMKQYTGAQQLTTQQVQAHTTNLFLAQTTGGVLKGGNPNAQNIVNLFGTGQGGVLNTLQNVYQNNEAIQAFANDPLNLNAMNLEKGMQNLANAVSKSTLAKPRESAELREQIRNQVKEQMEQNSPQARELRNREAQLDLLERQQVRYVMAQQNPQYETLSLQDPIITEKLNDLRKAREILEARSGQQYETLSFRKKDLEADQAPQQVNPNPQAQNDRIVADAALRGKITATKESLREYANREEYKDLKPDELIEIKTAVDSKQYELTDAAVLKEAAERAGVRALMQEENAQRRREGKSELPINDFNLDRRMKELRIAQQQLAAEGNAPELTDPSVVAKAKENRDARAQRFKGTITELLQAQDVYTREKGLVVDDNGRWPTQKIQEKDFGKALTDAKAGLKKQGTNEPFYRSEEVQERLEQLKRARAELGQEYQNQPLNHPEVIKKSYQLQKINPARFGIQEYNLMTEEQQKEYDERVQAIDFLRTVEGKDIQIHNRDNVVVSTKIDDLKFFRKKYEGFEGAETGLPLNDPKIYAAGLASSACIANELNANYGLEDLKNLGNQIANKPEAQAKEIVEQFIRSVQPGALQQQQQQQQIQANQALH